MCNAVQVNLHLSEAEERKVYSYHFLGRSVSLQAAANIAMWPSHRPTGLCHSIIAYGSLENSGPGINGPQHKINIRR